MQQPWVTLLEVEERAKRIQPSGNLGVIYGITADFHLGLTYHASYPSFFKSPNIGGAFASARQISQSHVKEIREEC